jgi:exo-1,4-beta-D-glucosaminidase
LATLPKVKLRTTSRNERKGKEAITHVTLENPSKDLAFFVRLKVNKGKDEILPVLWQDNYVSLLPGEKREISATYRASELGSATASVEVKGWNTE